MRLAAAATSLWNKLDEWRLRWFVTTIPRVHEWLSFCQVSDSFFLMQVFMYGTLPSVTLLIICSNLISSICCPPQVRITELVSPLSNFTNRKIDVERSDLAKVTEWLATGEQSTSKWPLRKIFKSFAQNFTVRFTKLASINQNIDIYCVLGWLLKVLNTHVNSLM